MNAHCPSANGLLFQLIIILLLVVVLIVVVVIVVVVILDLPVDEVDGALLDAIAQLQRPFGSSVALLVPGDPVSTRRPRCTLVLWHASRHSHISLQDARCHESNQRSA